MASQAGEAPRLRIRCCRATPTASPSPCSASIQIRQLTRGSQIPIAPAAPHYVPCARFPPLEAFGRRPAQSAAPSIICLVSRSGVFRIVSCFCRLFGVNRKTPRNADTEKHLPPMRSSARSSVEIIIATQHGSSWFDVPERFPSPPPPLANPYRLADRLQRTGTKPWSAICPLETDTRRRQRSFQHRRRCGCGEFPGS